MVITLKSQNQEILEHLQNNRGISAFEAYTLYGITRISARIYDLRQRGHNIINCDRETVDRRGKKTTFTEYRLVKGG